MKRVLTAVALVPLVLLAVFKAPLWLFALIIGAVAMLALHEYLNIAKACGLTPMQLLVYATACVMILVQFLGGPPYLIEDGLAPPPIWNNVLRDLALLLGLLPIVFAIPVVFRRDLHAGLPNAAVSYFGVVYVAGSLSLLIRLRALPFEKLLVVFVLLSVWAGDTAAYYVGRNLGRHKLAPRVSPNKTWEGAVASALASVGVAALIHVFQGQISRFFAGEPIPKSWELGLPIPSWSLIIGLGMITNAAAQLGDLFESAIKRGARVKDSGALLPGHGGVLDRIDALLFAIPAVWYYAELTQLYSLQ